MAYRSNVSAEMCFIYLPPFQTQRIAKHSPSSSWVVSQFANLRENSSNLHSNRRPR
jgi:hypothetical protein